MNYNVGKHGNFVSGQAVQTPPRGVDSVPRSAAHDQSSRQPPVARPVAQPPVAKPAGGQQPHRRVIRSVGAEIENKLPGTERIARAAQPRAQDEDSLDLGPDPALARAAVAAVLSPSLPTLSVTPRPAADPKPVPRLYVRRTRGNLEWFQAWTLFPGRGLEIGPLSTPDVEAAKFWASIRAYFSDFTESASFVVLPGDPKPVPEGAKIPDNAVNYPDEEQTLDEKTTMLLRRAESGQKIAGMMGHAKVDGRVLSHHNYFSRFADFHSRILYRFGVPYKEFQRIYRADMSAVSYRALSPQKQVELFHRMLDELAELASGGVPGLRGAVALYPDGTP